MLDLWVEDVGSNISEEGGREGMGFCVMIWRTTDCMSASALWFIAGKHMI